MYRQDGVWENVTFVTQASCVQKWDQYYTTRMVTQTGKRLSTSVSPRAKPCARNNYPPVLISFSDSTRFSTLHMRASMKKMFPTVRIRNDDSPPTKYQNNLRALADSRNSYVYILQCSKQYSVLYSHSLSPDALRILWIEGSRSGL
jgi:hypothetical protein